MARRGRRPQLLGTPAVGRWCRPSRRGRAGSSPPGPSGRRAPDHGGPPRPRPGPARWPAPDRRSGLLLSRVKSSTEPPARPCAIAAAMVSATPSGSSAKQFSRSADTGTSTAATSSPQWPSTSSLSIAPSSRPRLAAKPPLVVASASNPSEANKRADPTSHGVGHQQRRARDVRVEEAPGKLALAGACAGVGRGEGERGSWWNVAVRCSGLNASFCRAFVQLFEPPSEQRKRLAMASFHRVNRRRCINGGGPGTRLLPCVVRASSARRRLGAGERERGLGSDGGPPLL